MKKIAFLMGVLLLFTTLAACAPAQQTPSTGPDGSLSEDPTVARDTINLSIDSTVASMDPHIARTAPAVLVHGQIYEPLYRIDEVNGGYIPKVAEDYSISDDGLTWTFKIRENVKFQNGDILTANDVVFSFKRGMKAPTLQAFMAGVDTVEATDENTFVVHLSQPVAALLNQVTNIFIVSEREVTEQGETFGTKPAKAGSGAYILTAYDSSTGWTLEAFSDYWEGEAQIKHVNYKVVTDPSAALIAFENGELDFLTAKPADLELVEGKENYKSAVIPANQVSYVFLNWMRGELENDNVRKAIAHAINKDEMNVVAFEGMAQTTDFMENPAYIYCAPTETLNYKYDPELSKQLLKEAGYEKGLYAGVITVASGTYLEKIAQVLQSNLAAVGITVDIGPVEYSSATASFRVQDYDIGVHQGNGQGDYAAFRQRIASTSVGSYYVKIEGDKFNYKAIDALFDRGDTESDEKIRKEAYHELNNRIMETTCWLPVLHAARVYIWNADLNPVPTHSNYYVYEWSWN